MNRHDPDRLLAMSEAGPVTVAVLAEHLRAGRTALYASLHRLEGEGFVSREMGSGGIPDTWSLTEAGEAVAQALLLVRKCEDELQYARRGLALATR